LIQQLSEVGLSYLAYSIDSDPNSPKRNSEKAMHLLSVTKDFGIIPVLNTVLTNGTNLDDFRTLARTVIENGIFLSPLVCSPEVPDGSFSNASSSDTPSREKLREIVPWLAFKKLTTGRVAVTFSYLWILFNLQENSEGITQPWHCASNFRGVDGKKKGRGYLTLDSDGFIGSCQEFPHQVNLLDIPPHQLSLQLLDPLLKGPTINCPGCTYNCYIQEESTSGLSAVAELPSVIQLINVFRKKS
jgi:MoaA/NifB/PqqE/SkfB family radical SAM enzyme